MGDARTHRFANNATCRLGEDVSVGETSIQLENGKGALFPSPSAGQIFILTVQDLISGAIEIMYCTARTGDVMTVERGKEGTDDREWINTANVIVQNRITAGTLEYLADAGGSGGGGGGGGGTGNILIQLACSDLTTPIIAGDNKAYVRAPQTMTLTGIRASLLEASSYGPVTIDVKVEGASILSTLLTIDEGSKTSVDALLPVVIDDEIIVDDEEIVIEVVDAGTDSIGLIVSLFGEPLENPDPNFADVVMLTTMHTGAMVEHIGGLTIDEVGSGAISATTFIFGESSYYFSEADSPVDGTDRLVFTDAENTTRFSFPGAFTWELYMAPVQVDDAAQNNIFSNEVLVTDNGWFALEFVSGNEIRFRSRVGGTTTTVVTTTGDPYTDGNGTDPAAWQHIAVCRDDDGFVRIFVDGEVAGVSDDPYTETVGGVDANGDATFSINRGTAFQSGEIRAYIDQIRITKGVARYLGPFTPPTEPFMEA